MVPLVVAKDDDCVVCLSGGEVVGWVCESCGSTATAHEECMRQWSRRKLGRSPRVGFRTHACLVCHHQPEDEGPTAPLRARNADQTSGVPFGCCCLLLVVYGYWQAQAVLRSA